MISEARWIALLSSIVVTLVGVVEEIFLINRCRILQVCIMQKHIRKVAANNPY